jgi:serine/threonine protein kinase
MKAADSPVRPGDVLAGKYRVERVLGAGGMGVVVAATHLDLLEPRAVKLMHPDALADAEAVERFLREARAAALLKSEHVARVHDVGRLENGAPYLVMEHLEGADLAAALKRAGALPVEEAASYVLQAVEALAEAHGRGIVHRDLKPANLFLSLRPDGTACIKVLDFGISKFMGVLGNHDLTGTHTLLGSPNYMSPEQMHSTRDVDARSDIWSLGVILYQLLTRELPFRGRNITEVVAAVLRGGLRPPSQIRPDLPPGIDRVVLRCLQRDPGQRFADAAELGRALGPFVPGSGPLVESIARLVAAPARSSAGLPVAVLSESQRLALSPRGSRLLPSATPTAAVTPPPAQPLPVAEAGAASSGAWSGTDPAIKPGRSRAVVVVAAAFAAGIGGVLAWSVTRERAPAAPATSRPPADVSVVAPSPTVAVAAPPPALSASTSPAPPPSVTASASAAASAPARGKRPPVDPFGTDRK